MCKQKILDGGISEEEVRCKVCGREFKKITNTHLKTHDMTIDEYKEQFPDALLVSEDYRKKISGENSALYGRKYTEATKQLMRDNHPDTFGEKNHFFGRHHTKESKQSIGIVHLGKPSHMRGKHLSEETKQKLRGPRPNIRGENNHRYGKHHTDEAKQKLREDHLGMKASEETKLKMSKSHSGEKNSNWQDGISFEPYCIKFNNNLKERVRDFFGRCCYVCGKNEIDNGRKLDVHHVNYDKMVCCNDVKPLFVPLCKSCHVKTHSDREYWEEFFTISLEYLIDGQCFLPKGGEKR